MWSNGYHLRLPRFKSGLPTFFGHFNSGTKFMNFAKLFEKMDFSSLLANGLDFEERLGCEPRLSNLRGKDTLIPISTAMDGKTG